MTKDDDIKKIMEGLSDLLRFLHRDIDKLFQKRAELIETSIFELISQGASVDHIVARHTRDNFIEIFDTIRKRGYRVMHKMDDTHMEVYTEPFKSDEV